MALFQNFSQPSRFAGLLDEEEGRGQEADPSAPPEKDVEATHPDQEDETNES